MTAACDLSTGSRCAIHAYARRNPWIELRELEQEAHLASLTADPLWQARTVAIALSRFVASQRCPVSLPKHKGESWQAASGARRSPLQVTAEDGEELESSGLARVASEQFEPLEDRLDRERMAAEVCRILAEQSEAARLVLLAEEKSSEVAHRLGISAREVYEATASAMRALRAELCQGGRLAAWAEGS